MLEQNNKKKLNTLVKIVLIYSLILITITIICMWFYQKNGISLYSHISKKYTNQIEKVDDYIIEESIKENTKLDVLEGIEDIKRVEPINFTDKYYMNNVEIETKTIHKGNIIDYDYEGNPVYKLSAQYLQISGLKNKIVEEKINKRIKQQVEELILDEEIYDKEIERIVIYAEYPFGNFNDLLSISVSKSVSKITNVPNGYYDYTNETIGLNFRLDTGEELKLEELFTNDASIKNILAQSYYKFVATDYAFTEEGDESWNLDNVDYGKIENELFKYISKFNKQEKHNFYFTYDYVSIVVDEIICNIELPDYPEYVCLYNIVKTNESLYENGNLPKVNYVLGGNYFLNNECFEKIDNQTFLGIYNYYRENGMLHEEYQHILDNLNMYLDEIKEIIKNDSKREKGKGYIYHIDSWYTDYETNKVRFNGEKIEVDLENFDEEREKIYAMGARNPQGGEFLLSLFNIHEDEEYEGNNIYTFSIVDINDDGKLEIGQKKVTPENWEAYYDAELEY